MSLQAAPHGQGDPTSALRDIRQAISELVQHPDVAPAVQGILGHALDLVRIATLVHLGHEIANRDELVERIVASKHVLWGYRPSLGATQAGVVAIVERAASTLTSLPAAELTAYVRHVATEVQRAACSSLAPPGDITKEALLVMQRRRGRPRKGAPRPRPKYEVLNDLLQQLALDAESPAALEKNVRNARNKRKKR